MLCKKWLVRIFDRTIGRKLLISNNTYYRHQIGTYLKKKNNVQYYIIKKTNQSYHGWTS